MRTLRPRIPSPRASDQAFGRTSIHAQVVGPPGERTLEPAEYTLARPVAHRSIRIRAASGSRISGDALGRRSGSRSVRFSATPLLSPLHQLDLGAAPRVTRAEALALTQPKVVWRACLASRMLGGPIESAPHQEAPCMSSGSSPASSLSPSPSCTAAPRAVKASGSSLGASASRAADRRKPKPDGPTSRVSLARGQVRPDRPGSRRAASRRRPAPLHARGRTTPGRVLGDVAPRAGSTRHQSRQVSGQAGEPGGHRPAR